MKNTEEQTILLIEDNPGDSRLIKEMLNEITTNNYLIEVAETLKEGCEQIIKNNFVLILLDLNLPDSTGKATFDKVVICADNIPVVLVSGLQDEQLSLSLIKEGAQDYILKQELNANTLYKTIQFAIERKKLLKEIIKKTHQWEALNSYFTGREMRMVELKKEVDELLVKLGKEKKYNC
ncbi:MAG: response regulator [Paludibacter sp.]